MVSKNIMATVFLALLLVLATVNAQTDMLPVVYGKGLDGITPSDGDIVKAYPSDNVADFITDTVGQGNYPESSWWKLNLNNLETPLGIGDTIVFFMTDGVSNTTYVYTLRAEGTHRIDLNYDESSQDYDEDGANAGVDCNPQDGSIYPGAAEICGDGIDQDCNGLDAVCPAADDGSGGNSGSGSGGSSRGGGGSGSQIICVPEWECISWDTCIEGMQGCLEWVDNHRCFVAFVGDNQRECILVDEQASLTDNAANPLGGENEEDSGNDALNATLEGETDEKTGDGGLAGLTGRVIENPGTGRLGLAGFFLIGILFAVLVARRRRKGGN